LVASGLLLLVAAIALSFVSAVAMTDRTMPFAPKTAASREMPA
jgi:hypothetical protein